MPSAQADTVRVEGPGRGTRRAIAKAAAGTRPHRARRYRLAFDHGWDIVDEYMLNRGTRAGTTRAIARHFSTKGVRLSEKFVRRTLERYFQVGDPTRLGSGGCTQRRANLEERVWTKRLMREEPDLFFFEVRAKFVARFRWPISDAMISQAIHFHGEDEDDEELTYKALERRARQRNEEARRQCLEALTGEGALPECYVVIDESSLDRRTLRRRRGWAPRGQPARLAEMFQVRGANSKLQSLLAAVNKDGFILDSCDLVEGGNTLPSHFFLRPNLTLPHSGSSHGLTPVAAHA